MRTGTDAQEAEQAPLESLIERIAAGDAAAESVLIQRYYRGIRALAVRRCRPGDSCVDDICHDVLTTAITRLRAGALRDAAAFPAYLQASIAHAANGEYRRRKMRSEAATLDEIAEPVSSSPGPAQVADREMLAHALQELLKELPTARDREILRRFYLDEADKAEVCAQLQLDESHFHRVVHRARQRFRAVLERAGIADVDR